MSKQKTYTIALNATAQTDPIKSMASALMDVHRIMSMVNLPFRLYHEALRIANVFQVQLTASTAGATAAQTAQTGIIDAQAVSVAALNAELAEAIILEAALSQGLAVPAMAAGAAAAEPIVATAMATGAVATLQGGGSVEKTGLAVVHEGETFSGVGGGAGGGISITNHISVDPAGMDLTDFTNKMNQQLQSALRSHTRDIPS